MAILKKFAPLDPSAQSAQETALVQTAQEHLVKLRMSRYLSGAREGGNFLAMERINLHLEETSRLLNFSLKLSCEY